MRLWELESGDGEGVVNNWQGAQELIEDSDDEADDDEGIPEAVAPPQVEPQPEPPRPVEVAPVVVQPDNANAHAQARPAPIARVRLPGPPQVGGRVRRENDNVLEDFRVRPRAELDDAALQRFLRLAHDDQEDEWDSDEMEDDAGELGDRWVG